MTAINPLMRDSDNVCIGYVIGEAAAQPRITQEPSLGKVPQWATCASAHGMLQRMGRDQRFLRPSKIAPPLTPGSLGGWVRMLKLEQANCLYERTQHTQIHRTSSCILASGRVFASAILRCLWPQPLVARRATPSVCKAVGVPAVLTYGVPHERLQRMGRDRRFFERIRSFAPPLNAGRWTDTVPEQ